MKTTRAKTAETQQSQPPIPDAMDMDMPGAYLDEYGQAVVWEDQARAILKSNLIRRGFSYRLLAATLSAAGIEETAASVARKISSSKFSFVFFLQCIRATGELKIAFNLVSVTNPALLAPPQE